MDSRRFDAITRHLGGARSRRRALRLAAAGALAPVLARLGWQEVAGACKKLGQQCEHSGDCCPGGRCRGGRCRCKKNSACPASKPCCIKGQCRRRCDGECCANCFIKLHTETGDPMPDSDFCCPAAWICSHKPGPNDDRCCYVDQDERCVGGVCCCDGCMGAVACGGKCCAADSCCNGSCCPPGQVCAGNPPACVPADRNCDDCLDGECVADNCCTVDRICTTDGGNTDVCCKAGEYCENQGLPIARCCPINRQCNDTYRPHRARR